MKKWNKRVLTVFLEWDYGIATRGDSLEKSLFFPSFKDLVQEVEPFWIDPYCKRPNELHEMLLQKVNEFQPDLIFMMPISDQVMIETLDVLKTKFSTLAWFGDDQWRFDSFTRQYAPHYSYIATTDLWSVLKYNELGITPIVTQWAAKNFSEGAGSLNDGEEYEYEVSFVGANNEYRNWFIKKLEKQGIKVECFGAGWPNGRLTFLEMEQIFRKSKINLNISNSSNQDIRFVLSSPLTLWRWMRSTKTAEQIKARNFEIPMAGGFQLTNYVLGLEQYWNIGKEIAVYVTPEECFNQIKYYLHNEQLRETIATLAHERALNEHTYKHRLDLILEEIWGNQESLCG